MEIDSNCGKMGKLETLFYLEISKTLKEFYNNTKLNKAQDVFFAEYREFSSGS